MLWESVRGVGGLAIAAAFCLLSASAPIGSAQEFPTGDSQRNLQDAAKSIVDQVALKIGVNSTVWVKRFDQGNEVNVGISNAVADALRARGFTVTHTAPFYVTGALFREPPDVSSRLVGYRVRARIVSVRDGEEKPIEFVVENDTEGLAFTGGTQQVRSPPRQLRERQALPSTEVTFDDNYWVRVHPQSAYAVRVLVKGEDGRYRPVPVTVDDGIPEVRLQKGQVYALDLWNGTEYEAGASVFIDGLNRYAVSDDEQHRRLVDILAPYQADGERGVRSVRGYFKDLSKNYEFRIVDQEQALAAKLLPSEAQEIGSIAVVFRACWKDGDREPPSEETKEVTVTILKPVYSEETRLVIDPVTGKEKTVTMRVAKMVAEQQVKTIVGTGQGDVIDERASVVKRNFGHPREVVKIRYFATE